MTNLGKVAVRARTGIQLVVYGAIHPPCRPAPTPVPTPPTGPGRRKAQSGTGKETRSPNLLFLWVVLERLAKWHRLAGLVRPRMDSQSFSII